MPEGGKMLLRGIVGTTPRDQSFETKSGEKIKQIGFKLLEETAEIIPCVVSTDGLSLNVGDRIEATGVAVRALKFGEGFQIQLRDLKVLSADPVPFGSSHSVPPPLGKK
jgi:hypothetical protein